MGKVRNYMMAALILGMSLSVTACGGTGDKTDSSGEVTENVTEAVTETATEAPKENVDSELYDSFSNNEAKVLYRGVTGWT